MNESMVRRAVEEIRDFGFRNPGCGHSCAKKAEALLVALGPEVVPGMTAEAFCEASGIVKEFEDAMEAVRRNFPGDEVSAEVDDGQIVVMVRTKAEGLLERYRACLADWIDEQDVRVQSLFALIYEVV